MSNDKTALITGASSGIGFELAKILVQDGYDLVIVSQNHETLQTATDKLHKLHSGAKILPLVKDLSSPSSPQEIYNIINQNKIKIDILINNAGFQVYGNFHEVDLEESLAQISVNLIAIVKLTRLFLNDMTANKYGKILNIASTGSFIPCPLIAVYAATKAFILSFSEALSEELKNSGVTVTALCPGPTNTNFAQKAKIENTNLFSGKTMTPKSVARIGYKALKSEKTTVIAGIQNKMLVQSIRILPRRMLISISRKLMEKRN